jgi:hypothetical protein
VGAKYQVVTVRGDCQTTDICPAVHRLVGEPDVLYVQGWKLTDPEKLAAFRVPENEAIVVVPQGMFPEIG